MAKILERYLFFIACGTNSLANLLGCWRMNLGHASSVAAAGEIRQRTSALCIHALGVNASFF
jgi:hypothetical protein